LARTNEWFPERTRNGPQAPSFPGFRVPIRKRKETRKLERRGDREARLVYICHPFAADPVGNAERVRRICEELKAECVPLAPHVMLPAYIDEATERDLALQHCMRLVAACDEVRVYGEPTEGMQLEIAEARRLGVPVVVGDDGKKRRPPGEPGGRLPGGPGRARRPRSAGSR
jgi:hypothetical protein